MTLHIRNVSKAGYLPQEFAVLARDDAVSVCVRISPNAPQARHHRRVSRRRGT